MTGENRWRAGEYGLQEARKGVRFVELPPVLQVRKKIAGFFNVLFGLFLVYSPLSGRKKSVRGSKAMLDGKGATFKA